MQDDDRKDDGLETVRGLIIAAAFGAIFWAVVGYILLR